MWGFKKKKLFNNKKYRIIRQQVKYKNPLSKRKGIFELKPMRIINFFLLIGIIVFLYFFIFSNFYNITDIQVSGNQIISTDDVLDITNQYLSQNSLFFFKHKNIFIFNKNALKKRINEVIILSDLKVNKILPNTIKLTVTEKNSALKWVTNDKEYLVDSQGQIIKLYYLSATPAIFSLKEGNPSPNTPIQPTSDSKFIKIRDLSNQNINLGDFLLKPENVSFILDLQAKIKDLDYLKFNDLEVPNAYPQYLNVNMTAGWQMQLNLQDSLASQLNRLNLLIDQKIKKENLNRLEYIDLRLGESIYYLYKGQSEPKPESAENTAQTP
jgi:cell division septal protein FtsQ